MSEQDGIDDAINGTMRAALIVATKMAEEIARRRAEAAREAEQRSVAAARVAQQQWEQQRAAAMVALRPVVDENSRWWDTAERDAVVQAWQTAREWPEERVAQEAMTKISSEVKKRFGVDVDDLVPGEQTKVVSLDPQQADAAQQQADEHRRRARQDRAEANAVIAGVGPFGAEERRDQEEATGVDEPTPEQRSDADLSWGDADWHDAAASQLEAQGQDPAAVKNRVNVDRAQGQPPTEATRQSRHPRARKRRGPGIQRQAQRDRGSR